MSTIAAMNRTLADYLEAYQWQAESSRQWTRQTPHGQATLRHAGDHGDWHEFLLKGGAVPRSSAARVLADNDRLYGPVKLVAPPKRAAVCRADLPKEFPSTARHGRAGSHGLWIQDPREAWAVAVTACATGETDGLAAPPPPDQELVERLKDAGWSASLDDGQLHVHVHVPGLFRRVSWEPQHPPGVKLACDLLSLEGVTGPWHKAAMRVARAANERLPLVRFALTEGAEPQVLRAEVHMGCAPIPCGWLPTALEVVQAAISLVARELQALRDRELAELVLAAEAA